MVRTAAKIGSPKRERPRRQQGPRRDHNARTVRKRDDHHADRLSHGHKRDATGWHQRCWRLNNPAARRKRRQQGLSLNEATRRHRTPDRIRHVRNCQVWKNGTYRSLVRSRRSETPSTRSWVYAILVRALTAGALWWLVVTGWFDWLTAICLILAAFSTALIALLIWAALRARTSEA